MTLRNIIASTLILVTITALTPAVKRGLESEMGQTITQAVKFNEIQDYAQTFIKEKFRVELNDNYPTSILLAGALTTGVYFSRPQIKKS